MRLRVGWGIVVLSAMLGCRSGEIGVRRDGASAPGDGPTVTRDAAADAGAGVRRARRPASTVTVAECEHGGAHCHG